MSTTISMSSTRESRTSVSIVGIVLTHLESCDGRLPHLQPLCERGLREAVLGSIGGDLERDRSSQRCALPLGAQLRVLQLVPQDLLVVPQIGKLRHARHWSPPSISWRRVSAATIALLNLRSSCFASGANAATTKVSAAILRYRARHELLPARGQSSRRSIAPITLLWCGKGSAGPRTSSFSTAWSIASRSSLGSPLSSCSASGW